LQQSIQTTQIEIADHDKIPQIIEKLQEFNEMIRFENKIPQLKSIREATNNQFKKEIEKNLTKIDEICQDDNVKYEQLKSTNDRNKINVDNKYVLLITKYSNQLLEQLFSYVEVCKTISSIQERLKKTTEILASVIKRYSDLITDELSSCFNRITEENDEKNDNNNISADVEIMVQRLDMLSNFNEDYPHIYLRFLPIINNWQNKISQFSSDLQQDIKKIHLAHEPILLNQKLKIAKALTKLDKYVTCEKNKKIHDEYSLKLHSLFSFDPQDLTKCNDYTHAYETLLALDAINDSNLNHKKRKYAIN